MSHTPTPFDAVYHALVRTATDPHESMQRIDRFQRGVSTPNDVTLMSQELLDAHLLAYLPPSFLVAATHCLHQGLCTHGQGWLH